MAKDSDFPSPRPPVLENRAQIWIPVAIIAVAIIPHLPYSGIGNLSTTSLVALLWGILFTAFFYYRDLYEKEPFWLLVRVFLAGGVSAVAASLASQLIEGFLAWVSPSLSLAQALTTRTWLGVPGLDADPAGVPSISMIALGCLVFGALQEGCKFGGAFFVLRRSPEVNELMDGIVYGAAVGAGFAAIETIFRGLRMAVDGNDPFHSLSIRALSTFEHCCFSALTIFGWVRWKMNPRLGLLKTIVTGFLLGTGFHALSNFLVLMVFRNMLGPIGGGEPFDYPPEYLLVARLALLPAMYHLLSRTIDFSLDRSPFKTRPDLREGGWIGSCLKCGRYGSIADESCPHCGSVKLSAVRLCPRCGAKNLPGNRECKACGSSPSMPNLRE